MASYVGRRTRAFMKLGDRRPERRRSEARLKTYPSAIDIRAWCGVVEERRQHILELIFKGSEKCRGTLIPLETLIDLLCAGKNSGLKHCLSELWSFIKGIRLSDEDQKRLKNMVEKMDKVCRDAFEAQGDFAVRATCSLEPGEGTIPCPKKTGKSSFRKDSKEQLSDQVTSSSSGTSATKLKSGKKQLSDQGSKGKQKGPESKSPSDTSRGIKGSGQISSKDVSTDSEREVQAQDQRAVKGTYKTTMKGPGRITTRVTGIKPGMTIRGDPGGTISTRAQTGVARASAHNVFPSNGEKEPKVPSSGQMPKVQLLEPSEAELKADDKLAVREAMCKEQEEAIEKLKTERDELKKKLDNALDELEKLKKLNGVGEGVMPASCKEEIEALEIEIKNMRSGSLSPEQEAEMIKKEVDVLKRYCLKLKNTEEENEKLKLERDNLKSKMSLPDGVGGRQECGKIKDLKEKLKNHEALIGERDALANKVQKLEKELMQYRDLPEDVEVYKNRSQMLDSALEERDNMMKRVEEMKGLHKEVEELRRKSSRIDELEQELKVSSKNDHNTGLELKKVKSKCACLMRELDNVKLERDAMRKRIQFMQNEMECLKSKAQEAEMLKLERDSLQIRINELSHLQVENEDLTYKCKCLQNAAAERDGYRRKYEEVLSMECQCEVLRAQVDSARAIARERDNLVKQVGDLETCICEQEDEIKNLVAEIDGLQRNKDETQGRMKEALANMRAEVEKKDHLIAASEEKLEAVQAQLKSSIQGVTCETSCYKMRIDELERELSHAHNEIKCLQSQVKNYGSKSKRECDQVIAMKRELECARAENKKLHQIANKMANLTGDEHVHKMLKQSECAVRRVVEELGKQYREWDQVKHRQKGKFAQQEVETECHCDSFTYSESENEKDIDEIYREKTKLENAVKHIQNDAPDKELAALRLECACLQDQLQNEVKARKMLEERINYS